MSIEAISADLDEDDFRIRALQAANAAAVPSDTQVYRKPLDASSSIAPVSTETAVPKFRPELAPPVAKESEAPPQHFMVGILKLNPGMEGVVSQRVDLLDLEGKTGQTGIDLSSAEKQEALYRTAKEMETRNTWGILGSVAQYLTSASAVVLGIACVASGVGTAPGALLIASGGLGLTNQVLHDTRGWETVASWFTRSEELQFQIAQKIEMGAFFLSLGLGLAGGIGAYRAGVFAAASQMGHQTFIGKAGQAVGLGSAFLGAGSRLGGAVAEKRIAHLQARIRELETQMTTGHQDIYKACADTEQMIDTEQTIADVLSKSINAIQIAFD